MSDEISKGYLVDLTWIHENLSNYINRLPVDEPGVRDLWTRLDVADDIIMNCMDLLRAALQRRK